MDLLPYLLFLACPVAMFLMMKMMMHGRSSDHGVMHSGDKASADSIEVRLAHLEEENKRLRQELQSSKQEVKPALGASTAARRD